MTENNPFHPNQQPNMAQYPGGPFQGPVGPGTGPGGPYQPGYWPGGPEPVVFEAEEVRRDKIVAALSYLPLLVLIPIFACLGSRFARKHANQGLLVLILHFIIWVVYFGLFYALTRMEQVVPLILVIFFWILIELLVMGFVLRQIFACLNGKFVEFPLIGKLNLLK
ncbi:MAG: hypothetical protein LBE80_01100 [Deltaproteobacteria bacterium]|jgi:hypothetical protein|nr:hypothetical protein [Deltaproteobacteria bacterium]